MDVISLGPRVLGSPCVFVLCPSLCVCVYVCVLVSCFPSLFQCSSPCVLFHVHPMVK